jgi:hypothetical protein
MAYANKTLCAPGMDEYAAMLGTRPTPAQINDMMYHSRSAVPNCGDTIACSVGTCNRVDTYGPAVPALQQLADGSGWTLDRTGGDLVGSKLIRRNQLGDVDVADIIVSNYVVATPMLADEHMIITRGTGISASTD